LFFPSRDLEKKEQLEVPVGVHQGGEVLRIDF